MGRLCVIIYIYLYVHMFVFISCVHMHWFMFASVFFWFGHTVTIVGSPSVVFICTHKVWCLYVHIYVYMHICIHLWNNLWVWCLYVHIYVYMYICIHSWNNIHIYMHRYMSVSVSLWFGYAVTIMGSLSVVFICTYVYIHKITYISTCTGTRMWVCPFGLDTQSRLWAVSVLLCWALSVG